MALKLPTISPICKLLISSLATIAIVLTIFLFTIPASFKAGDSSSWWLETTPLKPLKSSVHDDVHSHTINIVNPLNQSNSQGESQRGFELHQSDLDQLHECNEIENKSRDSCPSYFSWIRNDLAPWKLTGISPETIETARSKADFRVVIVNGSLYTVRYNKCFESRDDFTLWGMLMLLQEYPGMVPDVDLMFNCGDWPLVFRYEHPPDNNSTWPPPPLFLYCTSRNDHYDIVFPDWSYWGWPEVNIAPWSIESKKIFSGSREVEWSRREPIAHWKGNYDMGPARADLIKCTVNNTHNYSLVTEHQNWQAERDNNFQSSNLAKQCKQRYKVYVQGGGWSVSLKYIMSCGSTMLQIEPMFQEFFARSTVPFVHFWPINRTDICNSIKFAVDWGNSHPKEAEAIGRCGQSFLEKEVSMRYVYQYMLHLLQEYGKLLTFKPVPPEGVEPMSLNSYLPGHELTLPKNISSEPVCSLPEFVSEEELLATQVKGYQRIANNN